MSGHCDAHHHGHSADDGVYLISPSGVIEDGAALRRACHHLQALGFLAQADEGALLRHQRFAGTDAQRVAAIHRSLAQPLPIVMSTRGGYGLSRILGDIDWDRVAASGKRFVGHSDFTAFNLALLARTGASSYAGPSAVADFGCAQPDALTAALFCETLRGELEILSFAAPQADAVDARGVLWGGNLAMLCSLVGTPWLPLIDGGILFLEDVGEHPYRIERMLNHLWHAGILQRQQAILLGSFTEYRLGAHDHGYDLPAVWQWLRKISGVPVVPGLPYGHVPGKATLPVGARVGLAVEDGTAWLVLHEHD